MKLSMIIIYDGSCGICNSTVQFVLDNKPQHYIRFVSFQSPKAQPYLHQFKIQNMDSIVVIENNQCYTKSSAILKIICQLQTKWRYLYYLIYTPKFLRDSIYTLVSTNRYRIMDTNRQCRLITKEEQKHFIM